MSKKLKTYTDEDIRKITARPELADGWFLWGVTKWERSEPDKGPVGLKLTVTPFEDPEDSNSGFKINHQQTLVLQETEESGEIEGFRLEQTGEYGAVLTEDSEPKAVWNKGEKRWICGDEELTSEEAKEHNRERTMKGLNGLIAAYNDESNKALDALVGKAFFAELKRKASNNPQYAGRVFANLGSPYDALPAGAQLVPKGSFVHGGSAPAGRPGAPKGNGKPARRR